MPDDLGIIRLKLMVMDPVKEREGIKSYLGRIPEAKRDERMSKAQLAVVPPINDHDEALRLYRLVLKDNPADFEAVNAAREILWAKGTEQSKAEAVEILQAAIKAKPDDKRLQLVLKQLTGTNPEEVIKSERDLVIELNPEPYQQAMKLYEFEALQSMLSKDPREAQKHRDQSLTHLQDAEKGPPDDGRVAETLFQYYLSQQMFDKAAPYAEKLAAKNWDQVKGRIYRFRLAMARNEIDKAIVLGTELTQEYGEFARSWVFLGQAHQAKRHWDLAVTNYKLALSRQSESPEALAGMIQCYYQMESKDEALRTIEQAMKARPVQRAVPRAVQIAPDAWGDPTLVLNMTRADRDASPNDPSRWLALGQVEYSAARKAREDSTTLTDPRKKDEAAKQYPILLAAARGTFSEVIKRWPAEKLAWAYLAEISDFGGDFAGGEKLLKDMIARPEFKESADPHMMLAEFYLKQKNLDAFESTLRAGIATFPTNLDLRRRLSAMLTQQRKFAKALDLLDVKSPVPDRPAADRRDHDAGPEVHRRGEPAPCASEGQPAGRAALRSAGRGADESEGNPQGGHCAAAVEPRWRSILGTSQPCSPALIRLNEKPPQFDEAIADLTVLRTAAPGHVEGRVLLAEAYKRRNLLEEAARELDDVIRRVPQKDDVRVNLIEVYTQMRPPSWTDVERLLREAINREPKRAQWRRMEAKMLSARKQHEAATITIRNAIMLIPAGKEFDKETQRDCRGLLRHSRSRRKLAAARGRVQPGVQHRSKIGQRTVVDLREAGDRPQQAGPQSRRRWTISRRRLRSLRARRNRKRSCSRSWNRISQYINREEAIRRAPRPCPTRRAKRASDGKWCWRICTS
ncbi:MAG: hypothetical protein QM813_05985 [Verrucomicrobiota bacterium]